MAPPVRPGMPPLLLLLLLLLLLPPLGWVPGGRAPRASVRDSARGGGTGRDAPGGAAGPGFPRDALSERCPSAKAESPRGRCPLALLTPLSALRPAGGSVLRPGPRPHVVLFILFPEWQPRCAGAAAVACRFQGLQWVP